LEAESVAKKIRHTVAGKKLRALHWDWLVPRYKWRYHQLASAR
jgi:hypothetical protein